MGISAQQILQSDPEYLQRELAAKEAQRVNPQGTAAGAIGALLGRGISNISQGRGFFQTPDYGLQRVSDVQSIMKSVTYDPDNPQEYYKQVGMALQERGYSDIAPLAFNEATKVENARLDREIKLAQFGESMTEKKRKTVDYYKKNPEQAEFRLTQLAEIIKNDPGNAAAVQEYEQITRAASEGAIEASTKTEKETLELESSKVNLQKARQDLQKANTNAQAAIDFFKAYGLDPAKGLDDQPNFKKIPASIRASAGFMPALFDAQQKALTLLKPTTTPQGAAATAAEPAKPTAGGGNVESKVKAAGLPYEPDKYEYRVLANGTVQRKKK